MNEKLDTVGASGTLDANNVDDSDELVTVAPREIHDLVYRASRVARCDAGTAERIAQSVTFAEIHYGGAVGVFCDALAGGVVPTSTWATAPDTVLAAEVSARTHGHALATFDRDVPLAAIGATLSQCLTRGVTSDVIEHPALGNTTVHTVALFVADDAATATSRGRIADADHSAHRLGVSVDAAWFTRLEAAAAAYLVAEATLDSIETTDAADATC